LGLREHDENGRLVPQNRSLLGIPSSLHDFKEYKGKVETTLKEALRMKVSQGL
jgi:hypothetical protein